MNIKKMTFNIVLIGVLIIACITRRPIEGATAAAAPAMPKAGTLYVMPGGIGDCTSWASACELQTALIAAGSGDEIWVVQGIYKPTSVPTDNLATFSLPAGAELYGGFNGTETSLDQRDWLNNLTVLSGDIDNNDITDPHGIITDTENITGTNSYHVVSGISLTETAVIDGFTITGGQANGLAYPDTVGGGLLNDGTPSIFSMVAIANSTFIGNQAFGGGGASNRYGSLSVTLSNFAGNYAESNGGGIANAYGQVDITGSSLSGNIAELSGGGFSNSIYGSATISNTVISNNRAVEMGGGIINGGYNGMEISSSTLSGNWARQGGGMYNGSPTSIDLVNVVFSGNVAGISPPSTGNCYGGAMYNTQTDPTLSRVDFISNTLSTSAGTCYGGGMYNLSSNPVLNEVTFQGNGSGFSFTSSFIGGGIYNEDSDPYLEDVLLIGNLAGEGAGIANVGSSPTLIDVTFEGNQNASRFGAGAAMQNTQSSPLLINVLFSLNSSSAELSAIGGIYNYQSNPSLVNVVFDRNTSSSRNTSAGGIYNLESNPSLINVTFSGNQGVATDAPGANDIYNASGSKTVMSNSILWGDVLTDTEQIIVSAGSSITISYSLVEGGCPLGAVCSGLLLDEDPEFADPVNGNLRLSSSSPAIDAGDTGALPADAFDLDSDGDVAELIPLDLERQLRRVDIPWVLDTGAGQVPIVDMGASEAQSQSIFLPIIRK